MSEYAHLNRVTNAKTLNERLGAVYHAVKVENPELGKFTASGRDTAEATLIVVHGHNQNGNRKTRLSKIDVWRVVVDWLLAAKAAANE